MQRLEFAAAIVDYNKMIAPGEKFSICYLNLGIVLNNSGGSFLKLFFFEIGNWWFAKSAQFEFTIVG